jgi:hypothetical protein
MVDGIWCNVHVQSRTSQTYIPDWCPAVDLSISMYMLYEEHISPHLTWQVRWTLNSCIQVSTTFPVFGWLNDKNENYSSACRFFHRTIFIYRKAVAPLTGGRSFYSNEPIRPSKSEIFNILLVWRHSVTAGHSLLYE